MIDVNDNSTSSPLEALFDIEPGSTPVMQDFVQLNPSTEMIDPETGEVVERPIDASAEQLRREERIEDLKIDGQLETIHSAAMQAFYQQQGMAQQVDPKFSARNSEVAAQYLNIALSATNSRAKTKYDRQKIRLAQSMKDTPSTVNNNLIVADRNELLKSLFKQDFEKPLAQQLDQETSPEKI